MNTNAIRIAAAVFATVASFGVAATASAERPPMPGESVQVQPVRQAVNPFEVAKAQATQPGQHGTVKSVGGSQIAEATPNYGK